MTMPRWIPRFARDDGAQSVDRNSQLNNRISRHDDLVVEAASGNDKKQRAHGE
jgi:hypothetical protein